LRFALWAVVGGLVGYVAADRIEPIASRFDASQGIAMVVAWLFALPGLLVLAGVLSPRLGVALKIFADREAWKEDRAMMVNSGIGCLLISLFLLSLLAVEPLGLLTAETGLAVTVAVFVAASWFTWRTWALMDELWRKVTSEATVIGYYLIFAPGAAWSAAAYLGLARPLGPLDWLSLFLVATLLGSVIASARRGLIENR
jgi:uncharacterized membrane protein